MFQRTFQDNLIDGRSLLLLDAVALSAMNIKDFDHIREIAYSIRKLFFFELTKFSRSISLAPEYHYELYKLFRVKYGSKYESTRRSDLWRKLQLIREKTPYLSHWETLERWLDIESQPTCIERIGGINRYNLYKCKKRPAISKSPKTIKPIKCKCMPPCECYWDEGDLKKPTRFKCLKNLPADEYRSPVCAGLPPCTCYWTSKKYITNTVLSCLQHAFPTKYGPFRSEQQYSKFQGLSKALIARYSTWEA